MVRSMTSRCSLVVSVADSPVVPMGTMPFVPLSRCQAIRPSSAGQSTAPDGVIGVTSATMLPLNIETSASGLPHTAGNVTLDVADARRSRDPWSEQPRESGFPRHCFAEARHCRWPLPGLRAVSRRTRPTQAPQAAEGKHRHDDGDGVQVHRLREQERHEDIAVERLNDPDRPP